MIFFTLHRLPIWRDLDNNNRNIRIFIVGIILYIILQSYLYSNYGSNNEFLVDYRHYIFYLIVIDAIIVGIKMMSENYNNKMKLNIQQQNAQQQQHHVQMQQAQMQHQLQQAQEQAQAQQQVPQQLHTPIVNNPVLSVESTESAINSEEGSTDDTTINSTTSLDSVGQLGSFDSNLSYSLDLASTKSDTVFTSNDDDSMSDIPVYTNSVKNSAYEPYKL